MAPGIDFFAELTQSKINLSFLTAVPLFLPRLENCSECFVCCR